MTDRPVLNQLNIVVRDISAMAAFYERLGLEIPAGPPAWTAHHREATSPSGLKLDLDSGAAAALWNAGWPADRTGVVIGFQVSSPEAVDQLYGELTAAGYAGQQAPYDAFWGARYAIVEDPDGNAVGLMGPVDPSAATAPPDAPG